jgi:two-component system chemotaxis response regulator CheB
MTSCPYKIIVIGTSLGGLHALEVLLSGLPKSFSVPVVIAQHRYRDSDESLCLFLQRHCALLIKEAEDKEAIEPGQVYFAPADYHLLVEAGEYDESGKQLHTLALSTEAPISYARPSIDALFESVADAYGKQVIGVVLTGASDDGAKGLVEIKAQGGLAVVQNPTTAHCRVMPAAALAAVGTAKILPLEGIAPFLAYLCQPAPR